MRSLTPLLCLLSVRSTTSFLGLLPNLSSSFLSFLLSAAKEDGDPASENADQQRRRLLQAATALSTSLLPTAAVAGDYLVPTPPRTKETTWPLGKVAFSLLPLAGTSTRRATVETEVVPGQIWTHDQIQGVVNVNVPVRQTVIRLKNGGLWVHNPVAPTPQLMALMRRLEEKYGPVKHIVLGTVALEHKATFGSFASRFPLATVWIQPGQWAFPVDLPIELLGVRQRGARLREIPVEGREVSQKYRYFAEKSPTPEWADEIEFEVLGPFAFESVGGFSETAFFHKATKTLLVTDTVVSVTESPPAIIEEDPRALLFHARDNATDVVEDTTATRMKGWRRMVQFGLVFFPSQIDVDAVPQAFKEASMVPKELRNLGQGAIPGDTLYPWAWRGDSDKANFSAISQKGKLFCPPILTKLILDREPQRTLHWVDSVSKRFASMQRIIPCHLNNAIKVRGSKEFSEAFDPLRSRPGRLVPQRALAEDLALLQTASDLLTKYHIVADSQVCDGEPARRKGRFAKLNIA